MFIISLLTWILILGILSYGLRRGSGHILFTGVCLLFAGLLIFWVTPWLGATLPLCDRTDTQASTGIWQLILFVPLFVLAFPLGAFINRFFQFNYDPFDFVPAILLGGVVGVLVVRFILSAMLLTCEGTPKHKEMRQSFVVCQIVYFEGWKAMVDNIKGMSDHKPPEFPE